MKRLLIFTLTLLLGCTLSFSQKHTTKKSPKSRTVATKQVAKKKVPSKRTTLVLFEGEINCRNFETHSKKAIKSSKGLLYNGARDVKVLSKGECDHIIDNTMHVNMLIRPDEDYLIFYNDLLKKGFKVSYSQYSARASKSAAGEEKMQLKSTGKKKNILGQECELYTCTDIDTINIKGRLTTTETKIENWYSTKYKVSSASHKRLSAHSILPQGILMKGATEFHSDGKYAFGRSPYDVFIASEVKSMEYREVKDSEMQIPDDYEIEEIATMADFGPKLIELWQDTRTFLKKNKMYPGDADKELNVTYTIYEEWDY